MKVACVQTVPVYRDIPANLAKMRALVSPDVDLHIFPELCLTGYLFTTTEELTDLGQPIDGPIATDISQIARENRTAIVTGFLEEFEGKFYNSALAFDYRGELVGHYRKVHRFYLETQIFAKGDLRFPVFNLSLASGEVARLGMMICYDWRFPESARSLALAGAEIIAVPSNIVSSTGMLETTLRTRAFENKVCLAFADRVGSESHAATPEDIHLTFQGKSAVIDYAGNVIVQASRDKEEVLIAEVSLEKTRSKRINPLNDIFEDRSPDSYRTS